MTTPTPEHRPGRTRQESAVAWLGTHAIELTGVGAPLVAGLIWSPWLDLVSGVVAALWAANEIRLRHTTRAARQAAVAARPARTALTTCTGEDTTNEQDDDAAAAKPGDGRNRKEVAR